MDAFFSQISSTRLRTDRGSASVIATLLIVAGLTEATMGWLQLTGWITSAHPGYRMTGSFPNPGPYCGFLAVVTPAALWCYLRARKGHGSMLALVYLVLAVPLMPVLMGRTGWIAGGVGMAWMLCSSGQLKLPARQALFPAIAGALVLGCLMFLLKPASAVGRLFLWRNGLAALSEAPLTGVGWNRVAGALGVAQERYFHSHPDSMFSAVAGSPQYAFNDFLQVGIAFGLPAMLMMVMALSISVYLLGRSGHYGLSGAALAFIIVCMGSYPLRFPEFIAVGGLLVSASVLSIRFLPFPLRILLCVALACGITISTLRTVRGEQLPQEWRLRRGICRGSLDSEKLHVLDSLSCVYGGLPEFLFDYGKVLRMSGHYRESNDILSRGLGVSSDPMFLNLLGRNCHDLGLYHEAEEYLRRSADRLPGRLYPYYLMCRLYADPEVADYGKFMEVYREAMSIRPKVMSPAITQMRQEMKAMHDSIRNHGIGMGRRMEI